MKEKNKNINFNDKKTVNTIWASVVAKYTITEMDDIFEECQVVENIHRKYTVADDFGQMYKRYITSRLDYNSSLKDEEQLRDIATLYVIMLMFSEENFGAYSCTIIKMIDEVQESGMLYVKILYMKGQLHLIDLPKPETSIIPKYIIDADKVNGKDIQYVDIYFSQRLTEINKQFADFIRQSIDEVGGMKEVSKTCNDFGLALKTYIEGRMSYIKYLRDTAKLYNYACLTQVITLYKPFDFGRYSDEIIRLEGKIAEKGAKILIKQAGEAGITLCDRKQHNAKNK